MGHFNRVVENILPIACAEVEAPQYHEKFRVHVRNTRPICRFCPFLFDNDLYLLLGFLYGLFYLGRLYPAIEDKILKRDARDLAAYGIVGRECNGARRVVDNNIDSRCPLKRAYIAPFFADNLSFYLVARERNSCRKDVGNDGISEAVDGSSKNFLCALFQALISGYFQLAHAALEILLILLLDGFQKFFFCFVGG